ncbi:hypothetical protein [Microbacterium sp. ZW T5_56]|uniref:hypothetical protein n=1 Tax=Microbacterium sp. ZW T5_56 TaxID=3378081 RepID=UPI0038543127
MSHPAQAMWISVVLGASGVMLGIVAFLFLVPVPGSPWPLITLCAGGFLSAVAMLWGAIVIGLNTSRRARVLIALLAALAVVGAASWLALGAAVLASASLVFNPSLLEFFSFAMGSGLWVLRVLGVLAIGALLTRVALIPTVPLRSRVYFFTALASGVVSVSLQLILVVLLVAGASSVGVTLFAATMLIALMPTFAAFALQNWAIESQR